VNTQEKDESREVLDSANLPFIVLGDQMFAVAVKEKLESGDKILEHVVE
jgi:hypothetical protein